MDLMSVFRLAHKTKYARPVSGEGPETIGRTVRHTMSEAQLRESLRANLLQLFSTTNLDCSEPLDDFPHVATSVLNYGIPDLGQMTLRDVRTQAFADRIRQILLTYEPRFVSATLSVRVEDAEKTDAAVMRLSITGELYSDPADIPVDFTAEVDLGDGKLHMEKLRVGS